MKRTFGSADIVGDQNRVQYREKQGRLIALIHYRSKRVLVQYVLTHEEDDEGDWKQ
jgi:mRNA interferase HigB